MTEPLPKPRPVSPPPPAKRYDVTRSQVLSLASENAELLARVAELEQHSQRLAARWENLTSELDEDLAEVVSRLSDDLTAANQQIVVMASVTAENDRLRELLRRWIAKPTGCYLVQLEEDTEKELGQ